MHSHLAYTWGTQMTNGSYCIKSLLYNEKNCLFVCLFVFFSGDWGGGGGVANEKVPFPSYLTSTWFIVIDVSKAKLHRSRKMEP